MLPWCFHVLQKRGAASFTTPSIFAVRTNLYGRRPSTRAVQRLASTGKGQADAAKSRLERKRRNAEKFKIKKPSPDQAAKLAAAFDELARKEGFSRSEAHFAKDDDFEDQFSEHDFIVPKPSAKVSQSKPTEDTNIVASDDDDDDDNDNDYIDFGDEFSDENMDERIALAQRDMDLGRVSVPEDLDRLAKDVTPRTLRELGFRRELNPFKGDQTPREAKFKLVVDAMVCPGCGSEFQRDDDGKPGFLPPEKFETQQKLNKIEEMRKLQDKAISANWSAEDEIDWLIQTGGKAGSEPRVDRIDVDKMADEMGIDLDRLAEKETICQRCHNLKHSGKIVHSLRPGWSDDPLLAQSRFRKLLQPISRRTAVIIALVDLFDFAGSVLPELDSIAGENPVIIAANKVDLLPNTMGPVRVEHWVRRELKYLGVKSLANIGGAVRLISCKTGMGVYQMLGKARALADSLDCDIYLVGAANAGKSTLLNYILRIRNWDLNEKPGKKRAGNANKIKTAVTASPLPGTTLKFIKVELQGGRRLYDTPGLLVPGTLTNILTSEELKLVVPRKQVEPVTLRLENGKCILIGALARVALIGDSRPFFFSVFVSNEIKIHQSDLAKSDAVRAKHAGGMLQPPLGGPERLDEIGEWEHHEITINGTGWKEAAADIALTGLGWIAVTGAGDAMVQISVPKGIAVSVRPPLMPFDVRDSTAKYTGSRAVRNTARLKRGKGVKGVGRN
ncbi:hypothetical protein ACA910_016757 [Epithemia clementina (nom. ined.)]